MAIVFTVSPNNLNPAQFDVGTIIPGKVSLKAGPGLIAVPAPGGAIGVNPAFVKANETLTVAAYNPTTKILTYKDEFGATTTIDLSGLGVDVFTTIQSFDPASLKLTMTDSAGATIVTDLTDLKKVVTANSSSVTLTGDGQTGAPLTAIAKIDIATGNLLVVTPAGLAVNTAAVNAAAAAATANALTSSGNTLTSTVNGKVASAPIVNTVAGTVTGPNLTTTINGVASAPINLTPAIAAATTHTVAVAGNTLTSNVNGLAPTTPIINAVGGVVTGTSLTPSVNGFAGTPIDLTAAIAAAATVDVQDAFGVHLFYALP